MDLVKEAMSVERRLIIIGSRGFIGSEVLVAARESEFENVIGISREDCDLESQESIKFLSSLIHSEDTIVFSAANVPCRDSASLIRNLHMLKNFISACATVIPRLVVYVSSDAVYADSLHPLTEESLRSPLTLHGCMHFTRELMLEESSLKDRLAILRPTITYGPSDPHNSYGPCRFARQIRRREPINIFGLGEEKRDFIDVRDVAKAIIEISEQGFVGCLNVVSGELTSFYETAHILNEEAFDLNQPIVSVPRNGPMPHLGLRQFDNSKLRKVIPHFQITSIKDGLARLYRTINA